MYAIKISPNSIADHRYTVCRTWAFDDNTSHWEHIVGHYHELSAIPTTLKAHCFDLVVMSVSYWPYWKNTVWTWYLQKNDQWGLCREHTKKFISYSCMFIETFAFNFCFSMLPAPRKYMWCSLLPEIISLVLPAPRNYKALLPCSQKPL